MNTENTQSKARQDRMQENLKIEHAKEMARNQQETLCSLLREQVIHTLGKPGDLLSVQVRPLWGMNYRVNIFAGVSSASPRISHSFFLVTDNDGKILESTPKIKRQY